MSDLQTFFATMTPYLRRKMTTEALVDRLGPSPSGDKRLAMYPNFILSDLRTLFNDLFPGLVREIDRHRLGLWDRMLNEFAAEHSPTSWRINLAGAPMSGFITKQREKHPNLPPYLEEIVDVYWTKYLANAHPVVEGDDVMDKTVYVRQYTHKVPQFTIALSDDIDAPSPEKVQTIAIIFRSYEHQRARILYPSIPALLALARRTNTAAELREQFASKVTEEQVDAGEKVLVDNFVLLPRS